MILDSSAMVAIIMKEPGWEDLFAKLASAQQAGIGAPTLAETSIVLSARMKTDPRGMLARFLQEFGIEIVPFGEAHWRMSVEAYRRYGKGQHSAALNFGDCMTYAVARLSGHPVLCTGLDFGQTDLEVV